MEISNFNRKPSRIVECRKTVSFIYNLTSQMTKLYLSSCVRIQALTANVFKLYPYILFSCALKKSKDISKLKKNDLRW